MRLQGLLAPLPLVGAVMALIATLGIFSPLVAQDTVETSSGIVATGELKSLRQGKVSFDVDDMQVVAIEIDDIVFLESPREFEYQTLDGQRFFGSVGRGPNPGTITVRGSTYRLDEIAYLRPIEEGFWPKTSGYLDVGFNAAKANSNVSLNTGAQFKYDGRRWNSDLTASSYYNDRSDVENAIERASARLAVSRLIGDRASAGGRVSWERNSELSLDARYQIGLGSGLPLWRTPWTEFYTAAWVLANRELYANEPDATTSAELGFNAAFDAFRYNTPELSHRTELTVYPSLTESGRYRMEFETRTSYEFFEDFFAALTFKDSYDNKPPSAEAQTNDWSVGLSVGWSW
jgi:hypothetical protein